MKGLTKITINHDRSKTERDLKIDDFVKITGGDLNALYKYLTSAYQGIRMGSVGAGIYIKNNFNDDSFFIKADLQYRQHIEDMENGLTSGFGM
tara:strand:+ start:1332 stop:1610 length:279 start_codon:yes stop_codon:yes gene_type:complete